MNERIRALRKWTGLSQKAFGERIGRTDAYICRMEKGEFLPPAEVADRMAEVFHVSRAWLTEGRGEMTEEPRDERSLGQRLRSARRKREMTQAELAKAAGCSRNAIGQMERGEIRPAPDSLRRIAEALWVREDWLRTGSGGMERNGQMAEIFELLRDDAAARETVRKFIEKLGGRNLPPVADEGR